MPVPEAACGASNEMKARDTAAIIVTLDDRITHYADRTVHITTGCATKSPIC